MNPQDEITKESLSKEEKKDIDYETGNKEADVYSEKGLEHLQEDDDEISPEEEGFMQGELDGGKKSKCATCGKIIDENDEIFERDVNGEIYRFCSKECDVKFQVKEAKQ